MAILLNSSTYLPISGHLESYYVLLHFRSGELSTIPQHQRWLHYCLFCLPIGTLGPFCISSENWPLLQPGMFLVSCQRWYQTLGTIWSGARSVSARFNREATMWLYSTAGIECHLNIIIMIILQLCRFILRCHPRWRLSKCIQWIGDLIRVYTYDTFVPWATERVGW